MRVLKGKEVHGGAGAKGSPDGQMDREMATEGGVLSGALEWDPPAALQLPCSSSFP